MRREAGFTLLEILMVLSLLGVLLALIAGAIAGANRAVAKAQRFTAQGDEVRAAQNFLRVAIGHALPLSTSGGREDEGPVFVGRPDSLTFVGPLPASLGGGLYRQQVRLVAHRLQVDFSTRDEQPFGEPQTLLGEVRRLRFSYRGTGPDGKPTAWLEDWPWPRRLPRAVRIDAGVRGEAGWVLQQVNLRLDLSSEAALP